MCASACALALAACETPRVVTDTAIRSFKPIAWSCSDTATTRKQVIEHNSVHATLSTGKRTVYRDDCPAAVKVAQAKP